MEFEQTLSFDLVSERARQAFLTQDLLAALRLALGHVLSWAIRIRCSEVDYRGTRHLQLLGVNDPNSGRMRARTFFGF